MSENAQLLDAVFGPGDGATAEERAKQSKQLFVRGLDLLTFDESPKARGRRLTAREALDAYGFDALCEIARDGSAIITADPVAVGRTLRERRTQLGVHPRTVASKTGLAPEVVAAMEASKRRPIREYERVARLLGLDERLISFGCGSSGADVDGSNSDHLTRVRWGRRGSSGGRGEGRAPSA